MKTKKVVFNRVWNYVVIILLVSTSFALSSASAGIFHWGDIAGTNVMFMNVTENNDEASTLFAPMPVIGGPMAFADTLHFDPQGFASQSSNNSADLAESTLSTVIMAGPGGGINSLSINELGDYSLGGLIGGQASAEVGAAFFWTILEIDNAAVSMATQATNLVLGTGAGANGGIYKRPGDDGTAVIWNGIANIDLNGFLTSQQIAGSVTKLRLTFDNTLQTAADDVSNAFIKKKSIDIHVDALAINNNGIPEPTTALLLGLGLAILPCCRRRS